MLLQKQLSILVLISSWLSAGEVSDAGDVLQALWDAAGGVWDPKRVPGPEEISLVKAAFFVHVAERVVCEPCGNKVTHTKDFYEQVICASATSIRRCQQVRSTKSTPGSPVFMPGPAGSVKGRALSASGVFTAYVVSLY